MADDVAMADAQPRKAPMCVAGGPNGLVKHFYYHVNPTSPSKDTRPRLFVTIDIEARGYCPKWHGIIAIGVTVHDADGKMVWSRVWAVAKLRKQAFEAACLQEFWLASESTRGLLERFQREERPAEDVIKEVYEAIAALTTKNKVTILSDAPEYDMVFMAHYLTKFNYPPLFMLPNVTFEAQPKGKPPMVPQSPLVYSSIPNVVSFANGLARQCIVHQGQLNKAKVEHALVLKLNNGLYDHDPVHDAEYIAELFFAANDLCCPPGV
jgi:oligoribonuclease (3'-5' exoribonuclease)